MPSTAALCDDITRTLQLCAGEQAAEWLPLAGDPTNVYRSSYPTHFTASALPLTPDGRRVCLVLHARIGLWVQPGGHFECTDESVVEAAARELREETGLTGTIGPLPALLSRHPGPCRLGAWHLDLQMLAIVSESDPTVSSESEDVAWFGADRLPRRVAPGVADLVAASVALFSGNGPR